MSGGIIAGLGQDMPFKEESFDVVLMSHVTEHISNEDLTAITSEITRVLRVGGTAHISPLLNENYLGKMWKSALCDGLPEKGVCVTFEEIGYTAHLDLGFENQRKEVVVDLLRAILRKIK